MMLRINSYTQSHLPSITNSFVPMILLDVLLEISVLLNTVFLFPSTDKYKIQFKQEKMRWFI